MILSTDNCNWPGGHIIYIDENIEGKQGFVFKTRVIKLDKKWKEKYIQDKVDLPKAYKEQPKIKSEQLQVKRTDLYKLGIIESENVKEIDIYPVIKGKGMVNEGLAIVEMVARKLKLPMRKELCKKYLEQQQKKAKN